MLILLLEGQCKSNPKPFLYLYLWHVSTLSFPLNPHLICIGKGSHASLSLREDEKLIWNIKMLCYLNLPIRSSSFFDVALWYFGITYANSHFSC